MDGTGARLSALLDRIRDGSAEAVEQLLAEYGEHILRAVRRRLHIGLRRRFDSQDFVQSVWATFFAHLPELRKFESAEELLVFLKRIASHKVVDEIRRQNGLKRGSETSRPALDEIDPPRDESLLGGRTPSAVLSAKEEWQRFLARRKPVERRLLELRAAGATYDEIAEELGIDASTARRMMRRIKGTAFPAPPNDSAGGS